ncbi:MAG: glutaredoxin domain-containing protein [Phaeovulum sp.]|uniref:glutaredoxin domain-containing protein n=1 Tax=Phaeovulum sp. TaxID=2934796 RepID=UPI00273066FD|nr:glutaredoxin domain-containing protein [Phaeovulum sp.]MDP2063318.1 glutaredoxin domain-containing protein [Phaeovulum sp.]
MRELLEMGFEVAVVPFKEYDLSIPEHADALHQRAPQARTVPQIFVGALHIGGFDNLNQKLSGRQDKRQ